MTETPSKSPVRQTRVGTVSNVLAGLISFWMPGLGQMLQGRSWSTSGRYFGWWVASLLLLYYALLSLSPPLGMYIMGTEPVFLPRFMLLLALSSALTAQVFAAREAAMWDGKETPWPWMKRRPTSSK